jgi:chemotaxis protein methyltransferase CheR
VVYDKPDCWRAHYQLAETYRQQGETGPAEREYRIVLRQLRNETLALQGTGALPSLLSVKDLRFLCETRLARLADAAA